jgi:hypothetical protein
MIGLPDGVGGGGLVAVDQVEGVGLSLGPLVGQGHQGRVEVADHGMDDAIGRRGLAESPGEGHRLAPDRGDGQGRLVQGEAFDAAPRGVGEGPLAPVAPPLAGQPGEPPPAIQCGPASGGAEGDAPVAGDACQRYRLFQGGTEKFEPLESPGPLGLREVAERRLGDRRERPSDTAGMASRPARRRMNRLSADGARSLRRNRARYRST